MVGSPGYSGSKASRLYGNVENTTKMTTTQDGENINR